MALSIAEGDQLSRLLETPRTNKRHDIWLWLYLYDVRRIKMPPETCNGYSMREEIAAVLTSRPHITSRINELKDKYLIPDDCLTWIDEGERQHLWLWRELRRSEVDHLPVRLENLTGRNEIIARLDIWNADLGKKRRTIRALHDSWLQHTARDVDFELFKGKKEGEYRCSMAWQWLIKNRPDLRAERMPITNHTELLIFFDQVNLEPYEQKDVLKRIMQSWSRKQYNERNKDSKQVNVMLTTDAINMLDRLAKQHGISRAKIVERLITKESELEMYLSD